MINLMKDFIDIAASNYYFEIKPLAYTAWKKTLNKKFWQRRFKNIYQPIA